MELLDFLTPSDEISANGGPEDHVVLSSRVRLARNISGVPFPGRAKKASREESCEAIRPSVSGASAMRGGFSSGMGDLKALDKQLLVERHLISREHAAKGGGDPVEQPRAQQDVVLGHWPRQPCRAARVQVDARHAVQDEGGGAEAVPAGHEVELDDEAEQLVDAAREA